ncbi:MAG TPA: hypothetical protein P5243_05350 [Bacteroidales bacterium]|jgi:hypothetical protein|nr:hypothetical protein [Bacteroidales bacterium]HRS18907.1 hypothetical protein [Bacteroidales bacterium]
MKLLNKITLIVFVIFLASCNRLMHEPVITQTYIEKLVPVAVPADSSYMTALFECDSTNKVIMTQLSEAKSARMETSYVYSNGTLTYKTKTIHDTVYVPKTIIQTFVEKPVDRIVEVNVLKWWQKTLIYMGVLMLLYTIWKIVVIIKNIYV